MPDFLLPVFDILFYKIAATLFALGLIVFVHELGHFIVAKIFGVRVLIFSLGFGKRLWGFARGGTDYRVCALPLGGFVALAGENPDEASPSSDDLSGTMQSKPRWQRILIYMAGPFANFAFSIGLVAGLFMWGIQLRQIQAAPAVVGRVVADGPAARAGVLPGDRILSIENQAVAKWIDVEFWLSTAAEKARTIEIERGTERLSLELTPEKGPDGVGVAGFVPELEIDIVLNRVMEGGPAAQAGLLADDILVSVAGKKPIDGEDFVRKIQSSAGKPLVFEVQRDGDLRSFTVTPNAEGRIQVEIGGALQRQPLPFGVALAESYRYNLDIVVKTFQVLGLLFTNEVPANQTVSGPLGIGQQVGEVAKAGFDSLLAMAAFLSISIGLLNLILPIPILDGGRIVLLIIESILRRDASPRVRDSLFQVGLWLAIALMVTATYFDIARFLSK
jgi:regulator of sigma E protease